MGMNRWLYLDQMMIRMTISWPCDYCDTSKKDLDNGEGGIATPCIIQVLISQDGYF